MGTIAVPSLLLHRSLSNLLRGNDLSLIDWIKTRSQRRSQLESKTVPNRYQSFPTLPDLALSH